MATAESIKARARLWLRCERALGLGSVNVRLRLPSAPFADVPVAPVAPPRLAPSVHPTRTPVPAAASVAAPVAATAASQPAAAPRALFVAPDESPVDLSPLPRERKIELLTLLDEQSVKECAGCRLCETRTNTVFGEGDPDAPIFFIGEGPGETEDRTGRPFVGAAGKKLDEMIGAMGLERPGVYIANIVKCRPPGNRAPAPDETEACTPYLVRQIEAVRPKIIVTLGLPAAKYMLKTNQTMTRLRGQWHSWRGIPLMPTFHPAYILRNYTTETRKAVWSDLQKVMAELGLKPTKEGRPAAGA